MSEAQPKAQQPAHWLWDPGLPALLADLTFQAGRFFYESRWIQLNSNSANTSVYFPDGYPDRGANYKVFALQFGDWRFGLQDAAVYVDRLFDAEYFFSPLPHILTQIVREAGKPWSETVNDNSITGLFAEWRRPLHYLYAQWLVDDISLAAFVPQFIQDAISKELKIPSKFAWSLGGYYDFPFGRLGFYHGGATKYTFSPNVDWSTYPYQYTYYPAVEYELNDGDSTLMTIQPEENYIGYKYGENNLAFLIDYSKVFSGFELTGRLEYVISGSKSPANPWHEYPTLNDAGRDTLLLDDATLEHTITGALAGTWSWRYLKLYSLLRLGGVFNKLDLEDPGDGGQYIYRPQPGKNEFIYQLTIGASLQYSAGR